MIAARRTELTRRLSNHRELTMLYILRERYDRHAIVASWKLAHIPS